MARATITLALVLAGCASRPHPPASVAEHLSREFAISLAEAERRAAHQDALHALIASASRDPAWAGLRIEHKPTYRIVLRFTDGQPRPELLALAPADLRPHIEFAGAPRSSLEGERLLGELAEALKPLKGSYNLMYDSDTGRFTVNVARKNQIEPARKLIPPHLRRDTDVVVGPQIVPT